MCERLVGTIHRLTFRQKKSEASKASEGDEEEAISTQGKLVKIESIHQWSKPQTEKPKRSYTINKKVDDFIARTKIKISRSVSELPKGRHPPAN